MRRPALALLVAAPVATGALALAQESIPIKISAVVKVTPNKAGTPQHPQGVRIDVRARVEMPSDVAPALAQTVDVWFPKAGVYNGGKFPRCSLAVLTHEGPSGCPPGSIMGSGGGMAWADTEPTSPKITVVNGGSRTVYFYVVLTNPARVRAPVAASITKLPASSRWSYRLHAKIPRSLQVVAGIPIRIERIHIRAGRGDWIASTSCPRDRRWRYHVETTFNTAQVVKYDGSTPCRP